MCTVTLNNELKGIELVFESKPESEVLNAIKLQGFRWHNVKRIWYAKQSEERIQFANSLNETESNENVVQIEEKRETKRAPKKDKNNTLSLWDRCKFTEGTTDTSEYNYKYVGSNYTSGLGTKEIAALIRKELKARFSECKFSVTTDYNSINVTLKSSPYENNSLPKEIDIYDRVAFRNWKDTNNVEINAIIDYVKCLVSSYNYDDSDSMTDYFNNNFYEHVSVYYDYSQTEQTEAVKADIEDYRKQLEAYKQEEEEKREAEFQEYLKQQEEINKAYKLREQEEKKQIEEINNSINIVELEDSEKYFVIGSQFAHLNKNNTLAQYQEEVKAGEFYLQNVEVTKEVHFQTTEALEYFSNLLLNDFEWIANTGGSRTDDIRINSMTDYHNMDAEERKTVEFYSCDCIAVYYNNELQFVIDAQGYSYARYVGLCENVAIQKVYESNQTLTEEHAEEYKQQADKLEDISCEVITENGLINTWNSEQWIEYKNLMKEAFKQYNFKLNKNIIRRLSEENEKLKVAMYKLLVEVDGIQEQFKDAELQQGQKVTLFYIGGMGGLITSHITIDKVENSTYAQYDNAVKVTFKQPRKHGLYYKHFYSDMLVYDGWQELPVDVLHDVKEQNGFVVTSSKFTSCDKKAYDAIMEYFEEQGRKPVVNTYKPTF